MILCPMVTHLAGCCGRYIRYFLCLCRAKLKRYNKHLDFMSWTSTSTTSIHQMGGYKKYKVVFILRAMWWSYTGGHATACCSSSSLLQWANEFPLLKIFVFYWGRVHSYKPKRSAGSTFFIVCEATEIWIQTVLLNYAIFETKIHFGTKIQIFSESFNWRSRNLHYKKQFAQ